MSVRIINADVLAGLSQIADESVHCVVTALSEVQVAYIAGLIDGEGSLECQCQMQRGAATPIFTLRLSFTFATAEPITTVAGWLGMTPKQYPATSPNRSPRWRLHIKNRIALPLLRRVLPHLILKTRQAEIILAIESVRAANTVSRSVPIGPLRRMPSGAVAQMAELHRELRSLKSGKRRMVERAIPL